MSDFTGVMDGLASGDLSAGTPPASESVSAGTSVPSAESSASATAPTADSGTTTPADPIEGQAVPYPRFREVNEARKAHEQALQRLSWASTIPEHAAPVITQFYQDFTRDGIGTLIREIESLAQADPTHGQALRSAAARWLGAGRGQAVAAEPMPEPDLQAGDGTLVYSAPQAQKLMEWRERRLVSQMQQQVQPLQQFAARTEAERLRVEVQAKANDWARSTYAQWSQKPFFVEHKQQIAGLMQEKGLGIADAYAEVLTTQVLPKLQATERSQVVAQMHQKAAAGTTNPSRGPAQGQPKAKTFGEAYSQLLAG